MRPQKPFGRTQSKSGVDGLDYPTCSLPPSKARVRIGLSFRVMNELPRTSVSIFVRKKQSKASCGSQTTGSFSVNEVFSTIGTPVRSAKLSISRR